MHFLNCLFIKVETNLKRTIASSTGLENRNKRKSWLSIWTLDLSTLKWKTKSKRRRRSAIKINRSKVANRFLTCTLDSGSVFLRTIARFDWPNDWQAINCDLAFDLVTRIYLPSSNEANRNLNKSRPLFQ